MPIITAVMARQRIWCVDLMWLFLFEGVLIWFGVVAVLQSCRERPVLQLIASRGGTLGSWTMRPNWGCFSMETKGVC